MILPFDGHSPRVGAAAFVAPDAAVIGQVTLHEDANVWYHCVLRGDLHWIEIGRRTNLQDATIVHVETGREPAVIGDDVTVGHRALLHGCRVGDRSLIGMGAVLLSGVEVGSECIIAAGSVLREGMQVPARSLVAGVPGVVKRRLGDEVGAQAVEAARHYVELARQHVPLIQVVDGGGK